MADEAGGICMLVDDMFFAAKIRGTAEAAGRKAERLRSLEQFAAGRPPSLLLVDLHSSGLSPIQAIEFFKSQPRLSAVPIIGFFSHVRLDLKRAAEEAGCDYVIPRSKFTELLPEIVTGNLEMLPQPRTLSLEGPSH